MEIYRTDDGHAQTADAIVLAGEGDDLSVLVVQRKFDPFKDCFAFPGGFLEKGEDPLEGCLRELEEETHLALKAEQALSLKMRERQGRDPRGLTRTFPFLFHIAQKFPVAGGDDAKDAKWIRLTELGRLAFDHGAILCEALSFYWTMMPTGRKELDPHQLPFAFSPKNIDELCLYGGSFNPWHEGHGECIAQMEAKQKKLIIIPDSNPLKPLRDEECFWIQYKSVAKRFSITSHSVFPGFLGMEQSNPTSSWIVKLNVKPSFVFGDDNLFVIETWVNYTQFLNVLDTLYIVPRLHSIKEIESKVSLLEKDFPKTNFVILSEHAYQDLSSTKLRTK